MTETTTTASMTTVLAELVLIATRKNLPTPKYMTMADGEPHKQINLTLGNRAELDEWNAEFGNVHVSELPPRPDAQDVLLTTMYGGWLLGWTVNLNARVPAPLSPEVLAALGEAARSDAQAIVAESLDVEAKPKVLTGEVTSPFGQCNGLALDSRDNTCTRFAAEFVESVDATYGTLLRRLCTPCADSVPSPVMRRPLTTDPNGYPVVCADPSPHGFTGHGHPCCGEAKLGDRPDMVARCNATLGCRDCQASAERIHAGGVS